MNKVKLELRHSYTSRTGQERKALVTGAVLRWLESIGWVRKEGEG